MYFFIVITLMSTVRRNQATMFKLFILDRNTWKIELLMLEWITWKYLTVYKEMTSHSFPFQITRIY